MRLAPGPAEDRVDRLLGAGPRSRDAGYGPGHMLTWRNLHHPIGTLSAPRKATPGLETPATPGS
jgi:hypothetical protein